MGVLPEALEIILEVQRKRGNEKITRKKKAFQLRKHVLLIFLFPSLWTPPTFKASNFLMSC